MQSFRPVFLAVFLGTALVLAAALINQRRPVLETGQATADLMRRRSDAPNGIMDYLFIKLFAYNKARRSGSVSSPMAETPAVCHSLHMPLQSGSDAVLRAMRRSYRRERLPGIPFPGPGAAAGGGIPTPRHRGLPGRRGARLSGHLSLVAAAGVDAARATQAKLLEAATGKPATSGSSRSTWRRRWSSRAPRRPRTPSCAPWCARR